MSLFSCNVYTYLHIQHSDKDSFLVWVSLWMNSLCHSGLGSNFYSIPNKPIKYSLMIFWVYDACIPCAILGMVYKQGKKVRRIWGENNVQHLCSKLRNTRDNITTDNCFSSVPLPQCLLQTLLWGLYNRTRQTSFLRWRFPSPGRFTAQSLHSNLCMVSYITKKGMAVWLWLLSMMHHNKMVDENTRKRKNIM